MRLQDLLDAAREKTAGFGSEKLSELAASVNEALPIIADAGFVINQIEVTLGVPPKVMLLARVAREISDEEYEALIERVDEKLVSSLVAGTFLKAASMQRSFKIGTLHSRQIEIELAPLPAVRLIFAPAPVAAPPDVGIFPRPSIEPAAIVPS